MKNETQTKDLLERFVKTGITGLPKYAQLRETILSVIQAGYWKPGEQLPTESELTHLTPYSLGTVQRALRALVDEGLIMRSQGSGTFVAEERASIYAPLHLRFRGDEGDAGFLPLYPKVLSRKRISERGQWSMWLDQKGSDIVRIDRRLSVNYEFNVFSRFYFNASTFPEIAKKPLAELDGVNLKQLLGGVFKIPLTSVDQCVSFVKFTPDICKAISTKLGTQGLRLQSVSSAGRGNPIYFLESFIPPNLRQLDFSSEWI
jgi:GntR family transcriptional regulator